MLENLPALKNCKIFPKVGAGTHCYLNGEELNHKVRHHVNIAQVGARQKFGGSLKSEENLSVFLLSTFSLMCTHFSCENGRNYRPTSKKGF